MPDPAHRIDLLVRFWELQARNAHLGRPLAAHERIELLSWMQLMTGDLEIPEPPDHPPRARSSAPSSAARPPFGVASAELIGSSGAHRVDLVDVGAGAIVLVGPACCDAGEAVLLRLAVPPSPSPSGPRGASAVAVEYVLPCSVVWVRGGGAASSGSAAPFAVRAAIALVVDGLPSCTRHAGGDVGAARAWPAAPIAPMARETN